MEIKNVAAIVSGGASGMGAATARSLAKAGARVALLDLDQNNADRIAKEIDGIAIPCDVTEDESVRHALEKAESLHGIARICVNCAGIAPARRMVGKQGPLPLEQFEQVIRVNLTGTFNLMRLSADAMTRAEPIGESGARGVIVNTASIAAFEGQIGQISYSASKGGIVAMTLPAARELAQFGIRVMTIAPGLVDTPLFGKIPLEARQSLAMSVPFPKRLADPGEYARLVLHIIENEMLNGEVIRLDGALRMQEK